MNRVRLKITGESGAGLLSTGQIVTRALRDLGFYVVADREYPSLIKGGHSCFMVNFSAEPIFGLSEGTDIMLAIDRQSMDAYFDDLKEGGVLIHGYERLEGVKELLVQAEERKIAVVHLQSREIAEEQGGNYLMANMVLTGMLWKVLQLPEAVLLAQVERQFADKPKLLAIDIKCVKAGYERTEYSSGMQMEVPEKKRAQLLIDGNQALCLGAVHAGVRVYIAYPMSPSSSILTHMSEWAKETGMMVKQGEDEITVAQMTLGAMYMGTRALCATSGGGYDLMTETVSLAGIVESPLVVVLAQRPGPGTGLPTWTMQGDLHLAMHSSHGEFPRVVIGVSDPEDCFTLIQHAFNFAEKYQSPVIVLTEKTIAESIMTVPPFTQGAIPIERGLVEDGAHLENADRYRVTENGLSKRWIPGSSDAYYFANGDEHWEDGSLTEEADEAQAMYAKRMRKMKLIEEAIPAPQIYGTAKDADIAFIGWGSSRNVMRDVIAECQKREIKVSYLHYEYLVPLDAEAARKFFASHKKVCLIEGNYMGQFGAMVEGATSARFAEKLLKYNGRPFFTEDVLAFIDNQLAL